jgi:hypothetical protein
MMMVEIVRTRDGRPAAWEAGGGFSSTGHAVIVAGPRGEALPAAYVRRAGSLACAEHALIAVTPECVVVTAEHHRGDYTISVRRVVAGPDGPEIGPVVVEYRQGVWTQADGFALPAPDGPLAIDGGSPPFSAAVAAAVAKAACYHCREPHFVAQPRHVEMGAR